MPHIGLRYIGARCDIVLMLIMVGRAAAKHRKATESTIIQWVRTGAVQMYGPRTDLHAAPRNAQSVGLQQ
jgi:hypothetical protein